MSKRKAVGSVELPAELLKLALDEIAMVTTVY